MEKKMKEIVITKNTCIIFPNANDVNGNILILGNYNGVCGDVIKKESDEICDIDFGDERCMEVVGANLETLISALENKRKIVLVGSEKTIKYYKKLFYAINDRYLQYDKNKAIKLMNKSIYTIDMDDIYRDTYNKSKISSKCKNSKEIDEIVVSKIFNKIKGMKFDVIIQNPPYKGSFHLDFFERGLDLLTETGKMVIIEPATWLINVRKNGKSKRYDLIKERINGHIESVVIENLNKEFGTNMFMPFAITTIDMSKTFDTIDYTCCGESRKVKSVYDCNLIGEYNSIWSIFEKVQSFGDMMKAHTTKENMGEGYWYTKYAEIVGGVGGALCAATTDRLGGKYDGKTAIFKTSTLGDYCTSYTSVAFHFFGNEISDKPLCCYDRGKHLTDKVTDNIYGTQTELENWKHFILNNKLPLFLNIVLTIDQHNNSKDFLPWLVDKQYTDDEINKLFGFTDEEIKLIDSTIKKYERNSPWFKRYMCGKYSASDEEVQAFIEKISNE